MNNIIAFVFCVICIISYGYSYNLCVECNDKEILKKLKCGMIGANSILGTYVSIYCMILNDMVSIFITICTLFMSAFTVYKSRN